MTIGIIATLTVVEGKNDEFETLFKQLVEQVLEKEEGCDFYALTRSKDDPQVYKVLERYKSAEDIKKHGETDHFRAASASFAGLLAAAPHIETLDWV